MKTNSEQIFEQYNVIKNHLEIALQFDLQEAMEYIPINYKLSLSESGLSYCSEAITYIYVNPSTLNYYVTIGTSIKNVYLYNQLPIDIRYKIYLYVLNLKQKRLFHKYAKPF